jgi:hypothetical protein
VGGGGILKEFFALVKEEVQWGARYISQGNVETL